MTAAWKTPANSSKCQFARSGGIPREACRVPTKASWQFPLKSSFGATQSTALQKDTLLLTAPTHSSTSSDHTASGKTLQTTKNLSATLKKTSQFHKVVQNKSSHIQWKCQKCIIYIHNQAEKKRKNCTCYIGWNKGGLNPANFCFYFNCP